MTYHFIYNPVAGSGGSKKAWNQVDDFLKKIGFKYEVHETQSEGHAKEIVNNLTHDTIEKTIISVGGDGTLCEVINGIDKFTNLTISLIPCGSGNDFVSATRIPTNPIKAIKFILNQRPRKINYINVNNNRAINVVGFGLDTEVLKFYYKLKIFTPKFRYKFATLVKTLFFKWHKSQVKVDDGDWKDITTMLLTVGNGQAIGGGIKMCPTAKIDDDMLDFTYIGKFSRFFTITNLIKVLKGKVLDLNFAKSVKCKSVEMKLPNKTYQYDGVLVRNEDTLKITIGKEKINFIG